jgi:hypothetical protein
MARKKKMSAQQEFEIMKLVLDKFLWLGFIVMGWGMYLSLSQASFTAGIWHMIAGAVLLIIFMIVIIKEYEVFR